MADSVIRFLLKGDAKGAKQAFKDADLAAGSLDGRLRAAAKAATGFDVGLRGVATAAAGAAAGMAAFKAARFVAGGFEAADAMAKLSRRLGVATEDVAAFQRAAELSGASQEAVTAAIERMSRTFGDAARGSAEAAGSLGRLGLDVQRMLSLSPAEAFSEVAAALAAIENPTLRSARAQEVLGRGAGQLATLIQTEAATMARARREAELFGTALGAVAAADVEAANDAISRLGVASAGLSIQMAAAFAPTVEWFGDFVQSAVQALGGMEAAAEAASAAVVGLAAVAAAATLQKFGLAKALTAASAAMARFGAASRFLALLGGPLGIAAAAALAIGFFATRSRDAAEATYEFGRALDGLPPKFRELSEAGQRQQVESAKATLAGLRRELAARERDLDAVRDPAEHMRQMQEWRFTPRLSDRPPGYKAPRRPPDPDSFPLGEKEAERLALIDRIAEAQREVAGMEAAVGQGRSELADATAALAAVEAEFGGRLAAAAPLQAAQREEAARLAAALAEQGVVGQAAAGAMARLAATHREEAAAASRAAAARDRSADAGRRLLGQLEPALAAQRRDLDAALQAENATAGRAYAARAKLVAQARHGAKADASREAAAAALAASYRAQGLSIDAAGEALAAWIERQGEAARADEDAAAAKRALADEGRRLLDQLEPARAAQEAYADAAAAVTAALQAMVDDGLIPEAEARERAAAAMEKLAAIRDAAVDGLGREADANRDAADAADAHAASSARLLPLLERLTGLDLGRLRGLGGAAGGGAGGGGPDLAALFSGGNLAAVAGGLALDTDRGRAGAYGYLAELGVDMARFAASHGAGARGFADLLQANFSFADLAKGSLWSFAGGFAGNAVGEGLFGKQAENSHLSTAGSVLGSVFGGPVGGAVGAFVGSLLDAAFGGDGFTRANVGAFVTPNRGFRGVNNRGERLGDTRRGASGLEFTPFARRGDKAAAKEFADLLLGIDAGLTAAARAAGVDVDLSGRQLGTGRSADDRGGTNSYFGASAGSAATPEQQARLFVEGWIDAVGDALPERVKRALDRIEGDAEELAAAFGAALQVDKLLGVDVIADVGAAVDGLLAGQRSLAESYRALSDEAIEIAGRGLSGADSLNALAEALLAQKRAAAQLALAYRALSADVDALIGGTVESIRSSLRSPEEQYAHLTGVAEAALAALGGASGPDEIARLAREANDAVAAAWRLLGPGQRAAMAEGLVAFLDEVATAAQAAIERGRGQLAADEAEVAAAGDAFLAGAQALGEAADRQRAAADKQDAAGGRQRDAADAQGGAAEDQAAAAARMRDAAERFDGAVATLSELLLLWGVQPAEAEVNA